MLAGWRNALAPRSLLAGLLREVDFDWWLVTTRVRLANITRSQSVAYRVSCS
jgi:hypothetical protein